VPAELLHIFIQRLGEARSGVGGRAAEAFP
jgi:hypothetical protein